jgi:hypothetical protein
MHPWEGKTHEEKPMAEIYGGQPTGTMRSGRTTNWGPIAVGILIVLAVILAIAYLAR